MGLMIPISLIKESSQSDWTSSLFLSSKATVSYGLGLQAVLLKLYRRGTCANQSIPAVQLGSDL